MSFNTEINRVNFTFDNAKFLYTKPYSVKADTVAFQYDYCCSLSTQDKTTYVFSITRPKTSQYVHPEISCSSEKTPIHQEFHFGNSEDDKLVEIFKLSKGKQYQFSFETEYGFIKKEIRTANFSMTLPE